ncbi:autotransporter outer membrane beta-barrel domain-containing protein [Ruegeria sp. MALMAid1280]|uniref:autotransporter outer membrane beta-barrel domain-containing protein n=1 Tax=Ruegeria sp. MALMAid1280 TaxID=3411634 RepID=UPI003BA0AD42
MTGNLTNSGTVPVVAIGSTETRADGFDISSGLTGTITNTGTISVNASGSDEISVNGIDIAGGLAGAFSDTGTIQVIGHTDEDDLDAYGVNIHDGVTEDISNSGVITLQANAGGEAEAVGPRVSGEAGVDILNSGTISIVIQSHTDDALGYGIAIVSGLDGDIINSGVISVQGIDATQATVAGIYVNRHWNGALNNSGTILAIADAGEEEAQAYGVLTQFDAVDADITNSESFEVQASSDDEYAHAYAIYFGHEAPNSNVTNTGSMAVQAEAREQALASGVYSQHGMTGDFSNQSDTTVAASSSNNTAIANGFFVGGDGSVDNFNGSITNTGSVAVQSSAQDEAEAHSFNVEESVNGDFSNSGSVTALSTSQKTEAQGHSAYVAGVFIRDGLDGSLTNSGRISAQSVSPTEDSSARGIYVRGGTSGLVQNSGNIPVFAQGAECARAQAVLHYDTMSGDVSNSGTVTATATLINATASADGTAAGLYIEDIQGSFSNSGVIQATASGSDMVNAYGLYFENFDGEIAAVGDISASSEAGDAYAIYLGTGTGTLNLVSTDMVSGVIRVQDHNVNLGANGGSAVFRFEDTAAGSGVFTTTVSDGRSGWFVQDEGGAAPIYASVDFSGLLTSADVTAFYGGAVNGSVNALNYGGQAQVTRNSITGRVSGISFGPFRPYAIIDATSRQFENEGTETDVTVFNGSVGYSGQLDNGLALALGLGVFRSDGDTDTTDFDTGGVYLDASVGRQFGLYTVEAGLGFGWQSTDRSREITGSADATADYDSTLVTAYLGIERPFGISNPFSLMGFGDMRHTRQKDDGYTETGSSTNTTVGDSTIEVIEARLGVDVERALNSGGTLFGQLSGVLRRDLGDTDASVTVFSTTRNLSFASNDFTGGSVLIGYEHELVPIMQFQANAEQKIGSDAQGPNFRGGLRWAF